jgi:cysteinyl-tRNA synthetase
VSILGLDEHTACIMDLENNEATIKGIGSMTLRRGTAELIFEKGERFSLDVLCGKDAGKVWHDQPAERSAEISSADKPLDSFWENVHASEESFHAGLKQHDLKKSATALLEIDRLIWQAHEDHESAEFISQARDILRDMVVFLATRLDEAPLDQAACLAPLVNELLALRSKFRQNKKWQEADDIRDSLLKANIIIEDSKDGSQWKLKT